MTIRLRVSAVWAAVALIVLTNAVALGHVFLNRSRAPDSTLRLSERELALPFNWGMAKENSGISLHVDYRIPAQRNPSVAPSYGEFAFGESNESWLDAEHLTALGFDVKRLRDAAAEKRGAAPTSKEVLLVLEFDGPAYAAALDRARHVRDEEATMAAANPGKDEFARRAKRAADAASYGEQQASRLFVVDAGLDRNELRLKYPDRQRYAIVRGVIRPTIAPGNVPAAWLQRLSVGEVSVPYEVRRPFERMVPVTPGDPVRQRDRFEATVSSDLLT
jgi:uncharacterized protein DUF4824